MTNPVAGGGPVCVECGRPVAADARFCAFCGTPVRPASDEVRKVVTLLFCDVTGSTTLGEELDPEVLRGLMTRYFAVARACVERHGGLVEKFVGDAVLAVFGIPEAREDDALRAVRAAAELRSGLAELSAELGRSTGARLQVRTGVNTGSVIAGAARAGGSFATGDAVNTAARLEQAAPPGEILLGEVTHALVRDAVIAEPVEPLPLKGKTQPVPAYRLVEVLDAERGRRRLSADVLVGRDAQLRTLRDAFHRAVEGDHLELVTVLGAAGLGKSTLVDGFVRDIDPDALVLTGRCLSYGHGITFWPITQMVRQAAGLANDAGLESARASLERVLSGCPDAPLAVARLLSLLGIAGEPGSSSEVFWAVRALLAHLAQQRPLVASVDDLHWAEPMLLDLLDDVRDELRDYPVLLLVEARPELLEIRPDWGSGSTAATTFSLDPLSQQQSADLLAMTLGAALPDEVVAGVDAWAAGNPLYVIEVGAHLAETGALTRDEHGWAVRTDLSAIPVPPTVTALLTARLDHLPEPERALLGRLSIIGCDFDAGDADAVAAPGLDVGALLPALHRRDVLRRVRSPGGATWAFRHTLVRDAAYDSLPKALRAEIHERFADRLGECCAAGAETEALRAHHLEQALRLHREISAPSSVLAALTERAITALTAAARAADDADNLAAATELTGRACDLLTPADRRRRRLLFRLAEFTLDRVDTAAARTVIERLRDLAETDGDVDEYEALALDVQRARLALVSAEPLDPAGVSAAAERLVGWARAAGDLDALGAGLRAAIMSGAMSARWQRVWEVATELSETPGVRGAWWGESFRDAASMWGPMPIAEALARHAGSLNAPAMSAAQRDRAQLIHIAMLAYDGQSAAAAELVAQLSITGPDADPDVVGTSGFYLSRYHLSVGDREAAVAALAAAADAVISVDALSFASTLLAEQAAVLLELGRVADAGAVLERAEAHTSPFDILSLALCLGDRAVLAAHAGRLAEAADLAEAALRQMGDTDQVVDQADLRRRLVAVARARGDRETERILLTEARARYLAKGVRPYLTATEEQLRELDARSVG